MLMLYSYLPRPKIQGSYRIVSTSSSALMRSHHFVCSQFFHRMGSVVFSDFLYSTKGLLILNTNWIRFFGKIVVSRNRSRIAQNDPFNFFCQKNKNLLETMVLSYLQEKSLMGIFIFV